MNCPDCDIPMWGVEYLLGLPEHYDGVSEWRCPKCGKRIGRWSHRALREGEAEYPFGRRPEVEVAGV